VAGMTATRLRGMRGTARIGLGLAAAGRPGYITLGRDRDLADRSVAGMRRLTTGLLDAAYAAGVRYADAARSYGRAEEFLAGWLDGNPGADLVVGSKWGYAYTGGWRVDAAVHEVKEHSAAVFDRQLAETRALLDGRLGLYLVHSVTPDSPALSDPALHERLARLAGTGVTVGLSVSGPGQAAAVRTALGVEVAGRPLFGAVQATFNVLEPSAGPALREAADAGWAVVVKEAMANGRLAAPDGPLAGPARRAGVAPDALALAWVLRHPWVHVVLSGAVTHGQLLSNLAAASVDAGAAGALAVPPEPAAGYWRHRASLPWS
jgi:aryl-alcohol dehydrogenase-like predicted oxidoreductase